jgi:AcrR family transcriptional regulator
MARKSQRPRNGSEQPAALPPPGGTARERIVAAFMGLLGEKRFEAIGFGDISARAGLSLAECREEFGSTLAILAAHMKQIDRAVLSRTDADMADEPPRERLFDVLMRRIEMMTPHREAVRSLVRSASRNPPLGFALNGLAVRSQAWMLTAANIDAAGTRGAIRAQGLAMLFGSVLRIWVDDDEDNAKTMAALDRALARGQRWSGMLDDLCRFAPGHRGSRRRRRDEDQDNEVIAA